MRGVSAIQTPGRAAATPMVGAHWEERPGPALAIRTLWRCPDGHALDGGRVHVDAAAEPWAPVRVWALCPVCGVVDDPSLRVIGVARA
jgi:hypothetical protein